MSDHRLVRKDHLILIAAAAPMLIIASSLIGIDGYFGTPKIAYSQSDQDQMNSNTTTNSVNIQDIPLEKVRVGDIDIAYKMFGKGEPILLFNGASDGMDAWDPSFLTGISSNHTVIAFDQRGIGNTTAGSKPYTYQQLANDTAGLLDALKIPKADVMGYSLGGHIAQEFKNLQEEIVNKTQNNIPVSQEEMKSLVAASLGSGWIRLHPESLDIPENMSFQQMKPSLPPETLKNQANLGVWEQTNWSGVCDEEAKLA